MSITNVVEKLLNKPCDEEAHEAGVSHPDYYPLSRLELSALVNLAFIADGRDSSKIQVRLIKAIPGHECPSPIEGPVARRETILNHTFVNGIRYGTPEVLTKKIARILGIAP